MKDLGEAKYCLGIQIERNRHNKTLFLHQRKYLSNLLRKFGMEDCKASSTPQEKSTKLKANEGNSVNKVEYHALVGSITYAVSSTRLDLTQALG